MQTLDRAQRFLADNYSRVKSLHSSLCHSPEKLLEDRTIDTDPALSDLRRASFQYLDTLSSLVKSLSQQERILAICLLCNGISRLSEDERVNAQALEVIHSLVSVHLQESSPYSPSILPLIERLEVSGIRHLETIYKLDAEKGYSLNESLSQMQKGVLRALCRLGDAGFVAAVGLLGSENESSDFPTDAPHIALLLNQNAHNATLVTWARMTFVPQSTSTLSQLALEVLRLNSDAHLSQQVVEIQNEIATTPTGLAYERAVMHCLALLQPIQQISYLHDYRSFSPFCVAQANKGLALLFEDRVQQLHGENKSSEVGSTTRSGGASAPPRFSMIRKLFARIVGTSTSSSELSRSIPIPESSSLNLFTAVTHGFCRHLLDAFDAHPSFQRNTTSKQMAPAVAKEIFAACAQELVERWIPLFRKLRKVDTTQLNEYQQKNEIAGALGCAAHQLPVVLDLLEEFSRSDSAWERDIALDAYRTAHIVARGHVERTASLPYTFIVNRCKELFVDSDADVNARAVELYFQILSDLGTNVSDQQIDAALLFDLPVPELAHGNRWAHLIRAVRQHLQLNEVRARKAAQLCLQYNCEFLHYEVLEWFRTTFTANNESFIFDPCEGIFREMLARDHASAPKLHHSTRDALVTLLERFTARGAISSI